LNSLLFHFIVPKQRGRSFNTRREEREGKGKEEKKKEERAGHCPQLSIQPFRRASPCLNHPSESREGGMEKKKKKKKKEEKKMTTFPSNQYQVS